MRCSSLQLFYAVNLHHMSLASMTLRFFHAMINFREKKMGVAFKILRIFVTVTVIVKAQLYQIIKISSTYLQISMSKISFRFIVWFWPLDSDIWGKFFFDHPCACIAFYILYIIIIASYNETLKSYFAKLRWLL